MTPWGYIALGLVAAAVGGAGLSLDGAAVLVGLIIVVLAGIGVLIGVIGEGVRIGCREAGLTPVDESETA